MCYITLVDLLYCTDGRNSCIPPPPKASDLVDPWFSVSKSITDGIGYQVKEEYVLHQNQTLQKQLLIHLRKDK